MTGKREDGVKCTVGNLANLGRGWWFAQEKTRRSNVGGRAGIAAHAPSALATSKHQRRQPKEGCFSTELQSAPDATSTNRVSEVGGKLNSAWFLIAPACDFLTDAITAN